jgi:exopolyphosphatase
MIVKFLLSCFLFLTCTSSLFSIEYTIADFLSVSKEKYEQVMTSPHHSETIHFVMGNESADLDSIVSSISYAYLLQDSLPNELYIPLLNIERNELALRKDALYLFQLFDVNPDTILFLDDNVPMEQLFEQQRLRLNLVDHNTLKPRQAHLSAAVERIVDHHADENREYPLVRKEDKLVTVAGSNATLIAEKFIAAGDNIISPELATFLLGPILIDTSNLKSANVTSRDRLIAEELQALVSSFAPHDYYQILAAAKSDVVGFTPEMFMKKDFKEYLDGNFLYGMSTIPHTISWGLEDIETIAPIIRKMCVEHELDFLILLMAGREPQTKKKMLVYSPVINLSRAFDGYIKTNAVFKDLFVKDFFLENFQMGMYSTGKSISRKQLQPLFNFKENLE